MGSRLEKNSSQVRKRIENHTFTDEGGEEYESSAFGGFGDYFRRKKIKLQNLDADIRASSSDKPQIFKGIVAHVSGYTQPPLQVLHRELVQHGAGFLQYLDSKTMATHIIASAMPPKKAVDFSRYRIVKPTWVMDSIQAGKLLPWSDYRVVDDGPRQKVLKFGEGSLSSQTTPKSKAGYRDQIDNSFYANQFRSSSGSPYGSTPVRQPNPPKFIPSPSSAAKQIAGTVNASALDIDDIDDIDDGIDESIFNEIDPDAIADASRAASIRPPSRPEIDISQAKPTPPASQPELKGEEKMPENMTSEEHNAWLLSDPRIRKSSTANPEFLKQYYSESRLHHLSTWKAELKSRMQRLAREKGPSAKVVRRNPGARRYVLHVDFDSFFCAVSLKKYPEYVDKPAVVAHSNGSGSEIASCNYPARNFGVKNGMWMKRAQELCPDLKVVPYDFPGYEDASRLFYEAILDVGGVVQSVSVDEALLDVTAIIFQTVGTTGGGVDEGSVWREQQAADDIALDLRNKIKAKTSCAVSVGIGGNILQAKVALRRAKPAGQFQLKPEAVLDMLSELEVKGLPGVAYSISGKLEEIGVKFVKDIRQVSKEKLSSTLGPKTGEKLWEYARGIDRAEVGDQPPRKSVSAEVNWGIRFLNQPEAEEFVMNLCKELERRLLNEQVRGKQLTMKIMRRSLDAPLDPAKHLGHGKCDTFNKSVLFGVSTHSAETIGKEAVSILRSFRFSPGDLRGLGVQLTKLEPIKAGASSIDGSQKRLTFSAFSGPAPAKKPPTDPIEEIATGSPPSSKRIKEDPIEDAESPAKRKLSFGNDFDGDPISDDPLTPRKPKSSAVHPALAIAKAGESDSKATTPLNIAGTQFIMPTQVDPTVLAELPSDIRSKLQGRQKPLSFARPASPVGRSGSNSPAIPDEIPSQVDPEVFNALPDDMKAEILASYGRKPAPAAQSVLPQSPRRERQIQPRKATTPTKRGGIRGTWGRTRERQEDAAAHRTQLNFVPARRQAENVNTESAETDPEELDPEFLSELPEDVRREVIEDHRRRRLASRSGLNLQAAPARRRPAPAEEEPRQSKLQFPAPPRKIAFTGTDFTSLADIKDMLEAWHGQSKDEGPHKADVQVFEQYLGRVVLEERDMDKAIKLVQWLDFLVRADPADGYGKMSWITALDGIKGEVQSSLKLRGLGPVKF